MTEQGQSFLQLPPTIPRNLYRQYIQIKLLLLLLVFTIPACFISSFFFFFFNSALLWQINLHLNI